MQKPTSQGSITLDYNATRQQSLGLLQGRQPLADPQVYGQLYELYHKLGANSELPAVIDSNHKEGIKRRNSYLNDLWVTMYLKNPIVPGHIPFDVIIEEFTIYAVQNSAGRFGNNQAAIIQQFNTWIQRPSVQEQLVRIRDQRYPDKAPKKLQESTGEIRISDLSTADLQHRIKSLAPFEGLQSVDAMINRYKAEISRRAD